MSSEDPLEAGQREALRSTDALLDRIGARAPAPEDLDDRVVAALALMAAQIDLDAVPVESTKAALERILPELRTHSSATRWSSQPGTSAVGSNDDEHLVLSLRDLDRDAELVGVSGGYRARVTAGPSSLAEEDSARGVRRHGRRPEHAAVALAPPRSLPRVAPPGRPGRAGVRPDGRPASRLRPLTALVVAVAAVVLGSGVSAAMTGGRSVNPLTGVQQVVDELTSGRSPEQQDLYDADLEHLAAAQARMEEGDRPQAVRELNRITTVGLSSEDAGRILAKVKQILFRLGGR
jgi:hypothetical protein